MDRPSRRRSADAAGGAQTQPRRGSRSPSPAPQQRPATTKSYFASKVSDQRVQTRPGAPPGGKPPPLGESPFEWVQRHAPERVYDAHADKFFTGTVVRGQVGRDEGLTGVRCMAAVKEFGQVWVGEREGCFSVWDSKTAERLMRSTKKRDLFVWSILGTVNEDEVWLGYSDSWIRVFDASTFELVVELKDGHLGGVYCLTGTANNEFVFSGSSDFTIIKWDTRSHTRLVSFTGHGNNVRDLLVVGGRLYSASDDQTIRVWSAATGQQLGVWEQHTGGVHALEFACGKYVWSAAEDKTIRVWEIGEEDGAGTCVQVIDDPHTGQINCLRLIGSLIWSTSWNQTFVWDPRTFALKFSPREHDGVINAVVPAHQSVLSRVWSASNDGVIKMWDTECTWLSALQAATDDRLQEAKLHLDTAIHARDQAITSMHAAEARCKDLEEGHRSMEHLMDAEREKAAREHGQLRQHWQDAQEQIRSLQGKQQGGDGVDAELLGLLSATQKGDAGAAAQLRQHLDEVFPAWKLSAAAPVVPVPMWVSAGSDAGPDDRRKMRQRCAFVDGVVAGPLGGDSQPRDSALAESWRRGASASGVVPAAYGVQRRRLRIAYVRGLTDPYADPPSDYGGAAGGSLTECGAFVRGRTAAQLIPDKYADRPLGSAEVREMQRSLREAFLKGLAGGLAARVPVEYQDMPSLGAEGRRTREELRGAFAEGQGSAPVLPSELKADASLQPQEKKRREMMRDAFLAGLSTPGADLPREYADDPSLPQRDRDQRKALRSQWFRGSAVGLSGVDASDGGQGGPAGAVVREAQARAALLRDALDGGLAGVDQPADTFDDEHLSPAEREQRRGRRVAHRKGAVLRSLVGAGPDVKKTDALAAQISALEEECRRLLRRAEAAEAAAAEAAAARSIASDPRSDSMRGGGGESLKRLDSKTLSDADRSFVEGLARKPSTSADRRRPAGLRSAASGSSSSSAASPARQARVVSGDGGALVEVPGAGTIDLGKLPEADRRRLAGILAKQGTSEKGSRGSRGSRGLGSSSRGASGDRSPQRPVADAPPASSPARAAGSGTGATRGVSEEVAEATPGLTGSQHMSARASQVAAAALRHPGLPAELQRDLETLLLPQQQQQTDSGRPQTAERVPAVSIDALRANGLEQGIRLALQDAVPAATRDNLDAALNRRGDSFGDWADRMGSAADRALQASDLPAGARRALEAALGRSPGRERGPAGRGREVADPRSPRDEPHRPGLVPEAVREVLADGGHPLPAGARELLLDAITAYDARQVEFAGAVRKAGGGPLIGGAGTHQGLVGAVRAALESEQDGRYTAGDLSHALGTLQGRVSAVEDAARAVAMDSDVHPVPRRRLRNALGLTSGSPAAISDAVRTVLRPAKHGLPADVAADLRSALAAAEGGGHAAVAECVRAALADRRMPEESARPLRAAVADSNGRAAGLRVATRNALRPAHAGGAGTLPRDVDAALSVAAQRRQQLIRAADAASKDPHTADRTADELADALQAHRDRGIAAARTAKSALADGSVPAEHRSRIEAACGAVDSGKPLARSYGNLTAAAGSSDRPGSGLGDADPAEQLLDAMRSAALCPEVPAATRRALRGAVAEADDRTAAVADAVRAALRSSSGLPAEQRGPLAAALAGADAEAAELAAAVRAALVDKSVPPATRAALHDAVLGAATRADQLTEAARTAGHDSRLPSDDRGAIGDAVAATAGKRAQLTSAAERAAGDSRVPAAARRVLQTALGLEAQELGIAAGAALRDPALSRGQHEALSAALSEHADRSADLRNSLRSAALSLPAPERDAAVEADETYGRAESRLSAAARAAAADGATPAEAAALLGVALEAQGRGAAGGQLMQAARKAVGSDALPERHRRELREAVADVDSASADVAEAARQAVAATGTASTRGGDSARGPSLNGSLAAHSEAERQLASAALAAGADGALSHSTRELLQRSVGTSRDDALADAARDALRRGSVRSPISTPAASAAQAPSGALPRLSASLAKMDGRAEDLRDAARDAAEEPEVPAPARAALAQIAEHGRVYDEMDGQLRGLLAGGLIPDGPARQRLQHALDVARGRADELADAADAASSDPALAEAVRRRLGAASKRPSVGDDGASRDARDDRHADDLAAEQQRRMEAERALKDAQSDLRDALSRLGAEERAREEAEDEARKRGEVLAKLGGEDEARGLADRAARVQELEAAVSAAEQRAQKAEARASVAQSAVPAPADLGSGEGGDADALRELYRSGGLAGADAALPAALQSPGSDRERDAWIRGRQDARGSVVPAAYADVPGLSDQEKARRRRLRQDFFRGLGGDESGGSGRGSLRGGEDGTTAAERAEAADLGRRLRESELKWLAAGGLPAAQVAEQLDAGLSGWDQSAGPGSSVTGSRAARRGDWLRTDVLGESDRGSTSVSDIDAVAADRSRTAELLATTDSLSSRLAAWESAIEPRHFDVSGLMSPGPEYVTALQRRLDEKDAEILAALRQMEEEQERVAAKEGALEKSHKANLDTLQKERDLEVERLKGVNDKLQADIDHATKLRISSEQQLRDLTAGQKGTGDAQAEEIAGHVLDGSAPVEDLIAYYKEREKKWAELGDLTKELQQENRSLLTESVALAQRLRALSFVFESRPALVKSLYELFKMSSSIPSIVTSFSKEAQRRQFSRIEITEKLGDVGQDIDRVRDGTKWIISNLFTAYELHHLGTSPNLFAPEKRRPTWRDIQVPARHREVLLSTWQGHAENEEAAQAAIRRSSMPLGGGSGLSGDAASPVRVHRRKQSTVGSDLPRVMPQAEQAHQSAQRRASAQHEDVSSPARHLGSVPRTRAELAFGSTGRTGGSTVHAAPSDRRHRSQQHSPPGSRRVGGA